MIQTIFNKHGSADYWYFRHPIPERHPHRVECFRTQNCVLAPGSPKSFVNVPRRAILFCKQDQYHRLTLPVSVHGRHGWVDFDTGVDELYVFDYLISDFPAAEPEGLVTGQDMHFRVVPRDVTGLKIGPLTINGTVGGRLPKFPPKGTLYCHGFMGMSIISHLHLFVVGNKIIFDPASGHFSNEN